MEKRDRIDLSESEIRDAEIYGAIKLAEKLPVEELKQQRDLFEQVLGVTIVDILIMMKDERIARESKQA